MNELPVLGVDIGGSKIAAGLVDRSGRVIRSSRRATPAREGRKAILQTIMELTAEVRQEQPIAGIGIGSGGVIADGVVISGTGLLTGWIGTDLVGHFTAAFGTPVTAVNDVHAHGVGEAWMGAGAGRGQVLVVAVGTGLGGAVVNEGRPMTGAHGVAGHLGHIVVGGAEELRCSCGALGHLEAIASGYGLVQLFHRLGGDPAITDAESIAERSKADDHADQAVRRSAAALGAALGDMINIIDPDVVIISGGVAQAGPLWWDTVRTAAAAAALPIVATTPILPATLGQDAGIIGAACCILNDLEQIR